MHDACTVSVHTMHSGDLLRCSSIRSRIVDYKPNAFFAIVSQNGRYIMLRALFAHLNNMPIDSEDFSIPIAEFDNVLRWIGPMTDGLIESVRKELVVS